MMNRRELLQGLGAYSLGQLLLGCQTNDPNALNVYTLKDALPPQLIDKFRSQSKQSVRLKPKGDLPSLYQQLQRWQAQKSSPPQCLVSLGDYWLPPAIQQGLIQPLDASALQHWDDLPARWQNWVKRDRNGQLSASGSLWGAPYRYGGTLIAYRHDKLRQFDWQPTDWSDLWRTDLKGHISLPDQAREVIGLTLKSLNQSYNQTNLDQVEGLTERLTALNQQVKFYSSDHYLQPLVLGDTWLAVGWSTDILPLLKREPDLRAIVPRSGTALWADVWVQAQTGNITNAPAPSPVNQWIDFWWQPDIAELLSQFTVALSPNLQAPLPTQDLLSPSLATPALLATSEFLSPLNTATLKQYQRIWTQMRQPV